MKYFTVICLLLSLFYAVDYTTAYIVSVTGQGVILATPPPSVALQSSLVANTTSQFGFNERQHVYLEAGLSAEPEQIASHQYVDSHFIYFYPDSQETFETTAEWTFSGPVLGIMQDQNAIEEVASSSVLGLREKVLYQTKAFASRGKEPDPQDVITVNGNTVSVKLTATYPGDFIRVVTKSELRTNEIQKHGDRLVSPSFIIDGGFITSPNGHFSFIIHNNGNLVVYEHPQHSKFWENSQDRFVVWESHSAQLSTNNIGPFRLSVHTDGNIVVYSTRGAIWQSGSAHGVWRSPYRLFMQNDGNLVLYDNLFTPVWATKTATQKFKHEPYYEEEEEKKEEKKD